jgi:hypothetical protein
LGSYKVNVTDRAVAATGAQLRDLPPYSLAFVSIDKVYSMKKKLSYKGGQT